MREDDPDAYSRTTFSFLNVLNGLWKGGLDTLAEIDRTIELLNDLDVNLSKKRSDDHRIAREMEKAVSPGGVSEEEDADVYNESRIVLCLQYLRSLAQHIQVIPLESFETKLTSYVNQFLSIVEIIFRNEWYFKMDLTTTKRKMINEEIMSIWLKIIRGKKGLKELLQKHLSKEFELLSEKILAIGLESAIAGLSYTGARRSQLRRLKPEVIPTATLLGGYSRDEIISKMRDNWAEARLFLESKSDLSVEDIEEIYRIIWSGILPGIYLDMRSRYGLEIESREAGEVFADLEKVDERLSRFLVNYNNALSGDTRLGLWVRSALLFVDFVMIHPFLDGNGTLGLFLAARLATKKLSAEEIDKALDPHGNYFDRLKIVFGGNTLAYTLAGLTLLSKIRWSQLSRRFGR